MMTKDEYLIKCESVINIINRIGNGDYVSPIERLNACKDAIEIFNYENNK